MQVVAILVGPQHPGNVGAAARAAANFGVKDLRFVAPECDVRAKEAYDRAIHAKGLLDEARVFPDLKSALEGVSLSIGTTARKALAANHFLRKPSDIRDAMAELAGWDGTLAWVFGREDSGLSGPEVDLLDQLVTIPTAEYWSLNLSHAVGICCYESFRLQSQSITPERTLAPGALVAMNEAWDAIVHEAEDREWRVRVASGVWRKVIGRSRPDTFEVHNIMGILANTLKRFGHPDYKSAASDLRLGQEGKLVEGKAARGETRPEESEQK